MLHGKWRYRLDALGQLLKLTVQVPLIRLAGRSPTPDWRWDFEVGIRFMRARMEKAFAATSMQEARQILDALVFDPPSPLHAVSEPNLDGGPRGLWVTPDDCESRRVMLYFHGGGYAFYAKAHQAMIAYVAGAARARTFALDYRLTPENPYPAQLDDAVAAYRWLLGNGFQPSRIVVAGDSAGGHLMLSLLLALRELKLPQPALGIGLCPWTDIGGRGKSLYENDAFDWVQGHMAICFGRWLMGDTWITREELSPHYRNLTELAPIYIQAGGREILHDMIVDFCREMQAQGARIDWDVWPSMPHDFQAFGSHLRESRDALRRIAGVVDAHLG